jgi:hypothetical protein
MFVVSSRKFFTAWISLLSIVGYGFFVFAAAPTGGYVPGQTNNPACAPGDVDCFVQPGWLLTGNAGTNATNNFIGTTDAQDFVIRTDNEQVAKFGTGTGVGACVVCSWVAGDTIGGVAFLGKMVYKMPPIIAIAMSAVPTSDPPPESAICP